MKRLLILFALLAGIPALSQTIRPTFLSQIQWTTLTTAQEASMTLAEGSVWYNVTLGCYRLRLSASSVCILEAGGTSDAVIKSPIAAQAIAGEGLTVPEFNGVVYLDGTTITTLEAAIDWCVSASLTDGCHIIDRRVLTETFTSDPFTGHEFCIVLDQGLGVIYQYDPSVMTVVVGSCVEWKNPNLKSSVVGSGGNNAEQFGLINSRVTPTTGSITTATAILTVASASAFDVGDMVAVVGASGGNTNQQTTLSGAHTDSVATITVAAITGWGNQTNYLLLDGSELVSCTGTSGATFTTCTRGAFGTTAAAYVGGENVDAVGAFIEEIIAVSGTTITLKSNATFTVTSVPVEVGSSNIRLTGTGTLDPNQNRAGADPSVNFVGFYCKLCRDFSTGRDILFKNGDHGGVFMRASKNFDIGGSYENNGRPADNLGSDIWFFDSNTKGLALTQYHRDGVATLVVDDRSANFSIYSGANTGNVAFLGPVQGSTTNSSCLIISGSNENYVGIQYCDAKGGVTISTSQWTTQPLATKNVVQAGPLRVSSNAVTLDSSTTNGGNVVEWGTLLNGTTVTCESGNTCTGSRSAGTYQTSSGWQVRDGASIHFNIDTAGKTAIGTGVVADAGGYKHKRGTAGCVTAAAIGATCTTTVSWTTALANTNYSVSCWGVGTTSGVPVNGAQATKAAASIQHTTVALTAVAAQFTTVDCKAVHD